MSANTHPPTKPWLSLQAQVDLLKSRGMRIDDESLAIQYLSRIGYYRMSGYAYPFRQHNPNYQADTNCNQRLSSFEKDTCFSDVVDLYIFDKKLRLLVMDALERIEISMRFEVAHLLGQKNTLAYQRPNLFDKRFAISNNGSKSNYQIFIENHDKCVKRSKEEFITHHKEKNHDLPIWVACEVWDFGMLSHLFAGMMPDDQKVIAEKFGLKHAKTLASWLQSLSILRNLCAHHSRLWNKSFKVKPKLSGEELLTWTEHFRSNVHSSGRVFLLLCVCTHMLKVICPNSEWANRLLIHLKTFPHIKHQEINLCAMGCCENWEKIIDGIVK